MPDTATDFKRQLFAGICRAEGDDDPRRFTLSFSSEAPLPRWDGYAEILEHTEEAVDLTRLAEIGVVLFNHDRYQVIAKVEKAWIENGRGHATILFDEDDAAETIRQKVESGTLRGTSVYGRVTTWEKVELGGKSADGRFDGPAMIAKRWIPMEISIVSIPADASVGVNRNYESEENEQMPDKLRDLTGQPAPAPAATPAPVPPAAAPRDEPPAAATETAPRSEAEASTDAVGVQRAIDEERQRTTSIMDLCRNFSVDPTPHITGNDSVDAVRTVILENLKTKFAPVSAAVTQDEGDKFRDAAADALLLRGGLLPENPAEGAADLRNLSIRELMNDCARREGVTNPERMADPMDLIRQYFNPTSAFPSILDQAINKAYVQGYNTAPTTFDIWTVKGTLRDFKPTKSYQQGNAGELLLVPEGGELKHDRIDDTQLPERQLGTYGRQFTLTRQAIINDDIGFVTSMPARYAASARRTLNKQVYAILAGNPVIFDGTPLFGTGHGNLVDPGTVPSMDAIQAMIEKLMLMLDVNGEPIANLPRYLAVPVGLGIIVRRILGSLNVLVTDGSGGFITQNNPLADMGLIVVEDAYLNTLGTGSNIAWYLIADKTVVPTIQVDYLNGQEIPTIRRMEYPGQLGYIWDIYLDWGITVLDYRGIIKNLGANA